MTEPTTVAGRALVEWAENAYPGQDQVRIWREHATAIEAEARQQDTSALRTALERLVAGVERINRGGPYIGTKDVRDARAALAALPAA